MQAHNNKIPVLALIAIIAAAVYSGHKLARELGEQVHVPPRARDRVEIGR